jgi:hypothetical protein
LFLGEGDAGEERGRGEDVRSRRGEVSVFCWLFLLDLIYVPDPHIAIPTCHRRDSGDMLFVASKRGLRIQFAKLTCKLQMVTITLPGLR